MSRRLFTPDYVWVGGEFELAMEFAPGSDERLRSAVRALWIHPDLEGCYADTHREPADQPRIEPDWHDGDTRLLGVIRVPNGERVACISGVMRLEGGSDWLVLSIPMGALGDAYRVGAYPFGKQGERAGPWLKELETLFAEIGRHVARSVPFQLALVGHEVVFDTSAADVARDGIPADRWFGFLHPDAGTYTYDGSTHHADESSRLRAWWMRLADRLAGRNTARP
jgi:hypothetical protein